MKILPDVNSEETSGAVPALETLSSPEVTGAEISAEETEVPETVLCTVFGAFVLVVPFVLCVFSALLLLDENGIVLSGQLETALCELVTDAGAELLVVD